MSIHIQQLSIFSLPNISASAHVPGVLGSLIYFPAHESISYFLFHPSWRWELSFPWDTGLDLGIDKQRVSILDCFGQENYEFLSHCFAWTCLLLSLHKISLTKTLGDHVWYLRGSVPVQAIELIWESTYLAHFRPRFESPGLWHCGNNKGKQFWASQPSILSFPFLFFSHHKRNQHSKQFQFLLQRKPTNGIQQPTVIQESPAQESPAFLQSTLFHEVSLHSLRQRSPVTPYDGNMDSISAPSSSAHCAQVFTKLLITTTIVPGPFHASWIHFNILCQWYGLSPQSTFHMYHMV